MCCVELMILVWERLRYFVYWMHIVLVGLVPVEVKWC